MEGSSFSGLLTRVDATAVAGTAMTSCSEIPNATLAFNALGSQPEMKAGNIA
jgi:hypothetical protein